MLNIHGQLMDLSEPKVMGIINLTPDSFYASSRAQSEAGIIGRAQQMLDEGADILDIGAYSSRPGASHVSAEEEMSRLRHGLSIISKSLPEAILSIDTFRADVARMCVEEYGAAIINDISAGELDPLMFRTIASLHVPYVIMHGGKEMIAGTTPESPTPTGAAADLLETLTLYFSERINRLHDLGVADIIVDPGFGFAKTLDDNYLLMAHLEELHELGKPLLVGISRKSMIYRLLGTTPAEALNGTTVLNTLALQKGASILRVHDVRAAREAVTIYNTVNLKISH